MCEPISIGIATAAASYMGQKQAADAQEASQAAASKAEQERAGKTNTSIRLRQGQENIARAQRKEAAQIKGMDANARARLVALTESGTGGQSLTTVLGAMKAKQARYSFSETQQDKMAKQQKAMMLDEERSRTMMNQLRINQPIKQASLLQSGLAGVQAGLSAKQALS